MTAVLVETTGLRAVPRALHLKRPAAHQGTAGGAFGYADSWQRVMQGTWSSPATSRLLLEAGVDVHQQVGMDGAAGAILNLNQVKEQAAQTAPSPTARRGACLPTSHARALDWNFNNMQNPTTWKASASYVTGAHNMKIRYVAAYNRTDNLQYYNATRLNYRFLSGVPNQLTMRSATSTIKDRSQYHAVYAQDQWTVNRSRCRAPSGTIVRGAGRLRSGCRWNR